MVSIMYNFKSFEIQLTIFFPLFIDLQTTFYGPWRFPKRFAPHLLKQKMTKD